MTYQCALCKRRCDTISEYVIHLWAKHPETMTKEVDTYNPSSRTRKDIQKMNKEEFDKLLEKIKKIEASGVYFHGCF